MNNTSQQPNPKVLLVEGLSDLHFVNQLLQQLELNSGFEISNRLSLSSLLDSIFAEINGPNRDVVGILVDADDVVSDRWDDVIKPLRDAGVEVPSFPDPAGTIIEATADRPRVGVWIMPDNQSPGELEDSVIDMIPDQDLVWPRSVVYIDDIVGMFPRPERRFSDGKIDRAKLYAWLATRKNPPHIGAAIGAGDFNLDASQCKSFVDWLERLFGNEN